MRLFAALLAATALSAPLTAPAFAQSMTGSGVAPSQVQNSQPRPLQFAAGAAARQDAVVAIVMTDSKLPSDALDASLRPAVEAAIASAKFAGKAGSTLSLRGIGGHPRILLVGAGGDDPAAHRFREAGGKAAQELKDDNAPVLLAGDLGGEQAADVALGYALGQYRFDRYLTVGKVARPAQPVTIHSREASAATSAFDGRYRALAEGVTLSRDLATEPANVIYPESFVERVQAAFAGVANVRIEVLDEAAMRRLNMGTLLGVGQGSRRPPRLLLVEYRGAGSAAPLAMVGKGITFDSGGISIKPAQGMWEMKSDMSGAASVMGAALSLAKSRAPVNVVAVAALAENMPGGNAQRPGDVVRTYSGKTIEMINADAEGRLVLADANEYVIATRKPAALVNIATLTGAIVNALDDEYAGLFARDDALGSALLKAGEQSGEHLWRMPLHKNYAETMKSDIADIKNAAEGKRPGAGLGAHFIGFFVDEKTPWAHLDIAGVNWADSAEPLTPKGATGFGVRLLDEWARNGKP